MSIVTRQHINVLRARVLIARCYAAERMYRDAGDRNAAEVYADRSRSIRRHFGLPLSTDVTRFERTLVRNIRKGV